MQQFCGTKFVLKNLYWTTFAVAKTTIRECSRQGKDHCTSVLQFDQIGFTWIQITTYCLCLVQSQLVQLKTSCTVILTSAVSVLQLFWQLQKWHNTSFSKQIWSPNTSLPQNFFPATRDAILRYSSSLNLLEDFSFNLEQ